MICTAKCYGSKDANSIFAHRSRSNLHKSTDQCTNGQLKPLVAHTQQECWLQRSCSTASKMGFPLIRAISSRLSRFPHWSGPMAQMINDALKRKESQYTFRLKPVSLFLFSGCGVYGGAVAI